MKPGDVLYVNNRGLQSHHVHHWLYRHVTIDGKLVAVSQSLIAVRATCLIIIPEMKLHLAGGGGVVCLFAYIYAGGSIGLIQHEHLG